MLPSSRTPLFLGSGARGIGVVFDRSVVQRFELVNHVLVFAVVGDHLVDALPLNGDLVAKSGTDDLDTSGFVEPIE